MKYPIASPPWCCVLFMSRTENKSDIGPGHSVPLINHTTCLHNEDSVFGLLQLILMIELT
jgi:hypothetical protein